MELDIFTLLFRPKNIKQSYKY